MIYRIVARSDMAIYLEGVNLRCWRGAASYIFFFFLSA